MPIFLDERNKGIEYLHTIKVSPHKFLRIVKEKIYTLYVSVCKWTKLISLVIEQLDIMFSYVIQFEARNVNYAYSCCVNWMWP